MGIWERVKILLGLERTLAVPVAAVQEISGMRIYTPDRSLRREERSEWEWGCGCEWRRFIG